MSETQNASRTWLGFFLARPKGPPEKIKSGFLLGRKARPIPFSPAIDRLLLRAGIPRYYQGNWFLDCRLEKSVLLVPDRESGQSIAKLFGDQLRAVIPDLSIRVQVLVPEAKPQKSAMKASWHKLQAQQQRLTDET